MNVQKDRWIAFKEEKKCSFRESCSKSQKLRNPDKEILSLLISLCSPIAVQCFDGGKLI